MNLSEISTKASVALRKELSAVDLGLLGVGAMVGTGIFVLTGRAAAVHAGPAVVLSFVLAAIAATFTALCYAEMASLFPVVGSAYTYLHATFGEFVAWCVGWVLLLEYFVGLSAVGVGWSGYAVALIEQATGHVVSPTWTAAPLRWDEASASLIPSGAVANVPALVVVIGVTCVLLLGIRASASVNAVMVVVKLVAIGAFLLSASRHVDATRWRPFLPENTGRFGSFGVSGVLQAATTLFYCYIGFEAVAATAQEAKNPQRSLPLAILGSVAVSTVLYMSVAWTMTGLVSYTELNVPHPLALAVGAAGMPWVAAVVDAGAVAGLFSVLMVCMLGPPRQLVAMALDGLVPNVFASVHPRTGTPAVATGTCGVVIACGAALLPIDVLGEMASVGTLIAFVSVSVAVLVLRVRKPDLPRPFNAPFGYLAPVGGLLSGGALLATATPLTLLRQLEWTALGLLVYAARRSRRRRA